MGLTLSLPVHERRGLDNSVLSTQGRCPRLDLFNYHLCRSTRSTNYPINYGVAYHAFRETLEKLYVQWVIKEEKDFDEVVPLLYTTAFAVATKTWEDPPLEHTKSYLDIGRIRKACEESFRTWVDEKKQNFYTIIGAETPFELPLPSGHLFTGKMDQLIEWNGRLWVRDFKTVGRKPKGGNWKPQFNPDHQFSGYVWAAQQLSGRPVDGVIVEIVYNIKTKGPEFHPTLCSRTKEDLDNWVEWVEFEYDNRKRCIETGVWPMRTTSCGDYNGCYFRECCGLGSWRSMENWLLEKTIWSVWDPLDPDREEGLPE